MLDVAYYAVLLQQIHEIHLHVTTREEDRAAHELVSALGEHFPKRYVVLQSEGPSDYALRLTDLNPDYEMGDSEETLPELLRIILDDGIHIPRTESGENLDALRRFCAIIKDHFGLQATRMSDLHGTTVKLVDITPPDAAWDEFCPAVDVVDLASRYVRLHDMGGGRYRGNCMLHDDNKESFAISGEYWCCYAACCGEHRSQGDIDTLRARLRERGKL